MLHTFKVVVAGAKGVGKTSLLEQLTLGRFSPEDSHSLGLKVSTHLALTDRQPVKLEIWDVAGEYYQRTEFYRGAAACMLVYDVTRPATLEQLTHWLNHCRLSLPQAGLVVVGNKLDLDYKFPVSWGQVFAHYAGAVHLTASARNGENVPEIFTQLAHTALQSRLNPGAVMIPA